MRDALPSPAGRSTPQSARRLGGSRAWQGYLAAGALVAVAYYAVPALGLVPRWAAKIVLYNGLGLSACVAIVVGVLRYRPERPLPWALFAVGLVSYATADVIFYTYQDILHRDVFPSLADVFYLGAYPFLVGGLLLLIRYRSPGADRASLLDALVITVGVGVVSWVFLIVPFASAPGLTLPERLVSMAYPIMDVLLLATVVRLAIDRGPRPPAFWVLLSGVGALLVTDSLYSIIQLGGGYHTGSPIDVGWMTWYACWGAAALHPSMRALADPAPPQEARLTRRRLALLAAASLLAPAIQAVQLARGVQQQAVVVAASVVLFVLVLARLNGLAGEVAGLAGIRKRLLDRAVQTREEERIRLAAELHDGPIQRLAGVAYTADLSRRSAARGELATAQRLLSSLEDDIRGEVVALRRVMTGLRPPALDEWGLAAALADYTAEFRKRTGIACTVDASLPGRLVKAHETVLYRVAQEALTNVAKHAHARTAQVSLRAEKGWVRLRVSDDGVGFATPQSADPFGEQLGRDHFGLASMRQQIEMAGGSWRVRSRPGHGTAITATLPMSGY
jgi:signal transduction histidine kinase